MSNSPTEEFADWLNERQRAEEELEQNISPNESESLAQFFQSEGIKNEGRLVLSKLVLGTSSFVVDHPVYGDVDSSTLAIDGDYDTGDPEHNTTIFTNNF